MKKASVKEFFAKRSIEMLGVGFVALGIFFALALLSYNPSDPSFNYAVDTEPTNWAGSVGAFLASPALSLFGMASILFVFLPLAWGYIIISEKFFPKWWLRITMMAICLPLLSESFTLLDKWLETSETWPSESFGGWIGIFIKNDLSPIFTYTGVTAACSVLALVTFYFAAGLLKEEWAAMFMFIYRKIAWVLHHINEGFRYLATLIDKRTGHETKPTVKKKRKASKPAVPEKKRRSLVEISKSKSKRSEPKKEAVQTSLDLKIPNSFELPPLNLLKTPPRSNKNNVSESALEQNARLLERVLDDFGVKGEITRVRPGPVVTLYELEPSPGTKSSRVIGLSDDIARSMSAVSARIAVVPGKNAIGIELPNTDRETVYFRSLLETDEFEDFNGKLALVLGKTLEGEPYIMDLAKMPHLLIAGTTGSGKSVGINAMILSLLYRYTPDECKFIMVDPKMLELSVYEGIPHLLSPVVTEPKKAVVALKWTVKEMENRYRLMSNLSVRSIEGYNKRIAEALSTGEELTRTIQTGYDLETGQPTFEKVPLEMEPLPYIVVVVDEMADLMLVAGKDIEASIQRLAQMARAAGIHIVMATQRPSVDVITGVIKANFPTRISFQVTSRIDSRTILGEPGAEQLLGMGDMLYMAGGSRITRVHGPFVDDKEVEKVVKYWKNQGSPKYLEEVTESNDEDDEFGANPVDSADRDELYDKAVEIVCNDGRASTSYVQRCLKIGYNRAANIIEQMEKDGIVSAPNHAGKREILTGT